MLLNPFYSQPYHMIDKLAYILIANRKILSTRSRGKTKYYIPGGKRELGESDWEALFREIQEELSVKLEQETCQYYGTFEGQADSHAEGVIVKMTCYIADYEGELKAASEIAEIVWLNSDNINDISPVDKLIFADLRTKNLID
ncbi:MAG: 8-oxo-dGTP diphosphatase [Saprospiraceae bacterium]|jgi:8-oxo-dGTP diphosphatase